MSRACCVCLVSTTGDEEREMEMEKNKMKEKRDGKVGKWRGRVEIGQWSRASRAGVCLSVTLTLSTLQRILPLWILFPTSPWENFGPQLKAGRFFSSGTAHRSKKKSRLAELTTMHPSSWCITSGQKGKCPVPYATVPAWQLKSLVVIIIISLRFFNRLFYETKNRYPSMPSPTPF